MFPSKFLPFSRYRVSGHSMEPLFKEGQLVWVKNWAYLFSKPRVEDIVVFKFQGKELVKRVKQVNDGAFEVAGDNSSDSLKTGEIRLDTVVGKVLK